MASSGYVSAIARHLTFKINLASPVTIIWDSIWILQNGLTVSFFIQGVLATHSSLKSLISFSRNSPETALCELVVDTWWCSLLRNCAGTAQQPLLMCSAWLCHTHRGHLEQKGRSLSPTFPQMREQTSFCSTQTAYSSKQCTVVDLSRPILYLQSLPFPHSNLVNSSNP